ncbi:MAG: response regulator transcription factor [Firmicutes bacterium]|nr:response regulator transcription factor [Bacillota bacterium]
MLKITICDDDVQCQSEAVNCVSQWAEDSGIAVLIKTFDNGDAMITHEKAAPSDIIILDIMMPLLNGIDAAKELRKNSTVVKIVFLTSAPEFAVESYDVKASGYLLKPIKYEKIKSILDDCMQQVNYEPEHLIVKTVAGYRKIYIDNIECIEAQNRKVIFTVDGGNNIEAIGKISDYFDVLTLEQGFFKCHRSYIVGFSKIDRFNSQEAVTKSGASVPIARGFGKPFKDAYFEYMFRKERD